MLVSYVWFGTCDVMNEITMPVRQKRKTAKKKVLLMSLTLLKNRDHE